MKFNHLRGVVPWYHTLTLYPNNGDDDDDDDDDGIEHDDYQKKIG